MAMHARAALCVFIAEEAILDYVVGVTLDWWADAMPTGDVDTLAELIRDFVLDPAAAGAASARHIDALRGGGAEASGAARPAREGWGDDEPDAAPATPPALEPIDMRLEDVAARDEPPPQPPPPPPPLLVAPASARAQRGRHGTERAPNAAHAAAEAGAPDSSASGAAEPLDAESLEWERARAEGGAWGGRGRGGRAVARQFASMSTRTRHVLLQNVHLAYAGKELLSGARLNLQPGRRYALLGTNGVGKSTLLRQIARGALPGFPQHLSVALVAQDEGDEQHGASSARVPAARDARPPLDRLIELVGTSRLDALRAERAALEAALDELAARAAREAVDGAETDPPAERERAAAELSATAEQLCLVEQELDELGVGSDGALGEQGRRPRSASDGGAQPEAMLCALGFCDACAACVAATGATRTAEPRAQCARPCMRCTPSHELSGGWRMRLRLAAALLSGADLLLLDEPTNHLDMPAALWLEVALRGTGGAEPGAGACALGEASGGGGALAAAAALRLAECMLLLVSHDATFIRAVATDIIAFETDAAQRGTLRQFRGGLDEFERAEAEAAQRLGSRLDARARQEAAARASADALRRAAQRAHGTDGGGAAARQAKQKAAKAERIGLFREDGKAFKLNSLKTLDEKALRLPSRAEASQLCADPSELPFRFPTPPRGGMRGLSDADDALVALDGAAVGYARAAGAAADGGRAPVLRELTLALRASARVAIVGDNGQGKSTLLRLLHGELQPCEGSARARPGVRIAYAPQQLADALAPHGAQPAARCYDGERFGAGELEARTRLGRFGLRGGTAMLPINALSGGQRVRLALAALTWDRPHALLLDEPTNHLDTHALDALAAGLRAFAGAVALVSHNRHFCAQVCDELWVVEAGSAHRMRADAPDAPFAALFASHEARVLAAALARGSADGGARAGTTARAARRVAELDASDVRAAGGTRRGAGGKRGGAGAARIALL
ncbi:hypothetical protein KFE25_011045 [Diacronema lutheri]|uniref:ABC transporter domain-containing protein n=1 Tax=Diacronema lutheri TaxID=2081491 RepID=A0A8J6C6C9_DIALT|nr:hypothetical protein KFE25_011045 [Diacronema lutheri]